MSAALTIEPVSVTMLRFQFDHLGYTLCGDHVNKARGGQVEEREARDILRSAETDDAAIWTCDTCNRHVTAWPTVVRTVNCVIEHTPCRIF